MTGEIARDRDELVNQQHISSNSSRATSCSSNIGFHVLHTGLSVTTRLVLPPVRHLYI